MCMVVCIFAPDKEVRGHFNGRFWGVQLAATHCNTLQHTATHATPPPLIEGGLAIERERGLKYVYKWERNRWYNWSILKDTDRLKMSSWFDSMFVFAKKRKEVRNGCLSKVGWRIPILITALGRSKIFSPKCGFLFLFGWIPNEESGGRLTTHFD